MVESHTAHAVRTPWQVRAHVVVTRGEAAAAGFVLNGAAIGHAQPPAAAPPRPPPGAVEEADEALPGAEARAADAPREALDALLALQRRGGRRPMLASALLRSRDTAACRM